jgi:hypothetical protein
MKTHDFTVPKFREMGAALLQSVSDFMLFLTNL